MPEFNFNINAPQGQVQAGGPRDQGTAIRSQANINLAQGIQQIAGGIEQIARDEIKEEAESDMSAFQAMRIEKEQAFREKAATITNDEDYTKAVNKYVTDLDKYAAGKREDGTKVFRNGMGSSAYKQFSTNYNAKFKVAGKEHVFQLKRDRSKKNHRIAINSGIKNNNPEAIRINYDQLVNTNQITAEDRAVQETRDMKAMAINHLQQSKATLMFGTEELLNQVNQEQVSFDGTGVKPRTDSMAEATEIITGAFENYKAEVYTNDNLEETEKLALVTAAKDSLKFLNLAKKTEYAAQKEARAVETAGLHSNYMRDITKDPANIVQIGKDYSDQYKNLEEKTLQHIMSNSISARKRFTKAEGDFAEKAFNRMADLSLRSSIMSSNLSTGKDYDAAINELSKIGDPVLRTATHKWIEENKPGSTPKNPELNAKVKSLHEDLKMSLGLDLTRAQAAKLNKFQKYGMEDTLGYNSRPDKFPDPKESLQEYIGGLTRGQRQDSQYTIEQEYIEIYNKDGQVAAEEYKEKALEGINKDNNTAGFFEIFIKPSYLKKR